MYLKVLYLILVLNLLNEASGDCGCSLNRNSECSTQEEKPSDKYSKELNVDAEQGNGDINQPNDNIQEEDNIGNFDDTEKLDNKEKLNNNIDNKDNSIDSSSTNGNTDKTKGSETKDNLISIEIESDPNNLSDETDLDIKFNNMVLIEEGIFEMGTDKPVFAMDIEGPLRNKSVRSFYLDKYEVSNEDFSKFVKETKYKTEAEVFGDSFIFEMLLPEEDRDKYEDVRAAHAPWWIKMKGVSWKKPEGKGSNIKGNLCLI